MMIYKKRMLLLAVVCGLSGCNLKTNETVSAVKDEFIQEKESADSQKSTRHVPVIVKQGKESIDLYELIVSQKGYSKKAKSWVVGDGAQLSNVLSEAASELPLAVWVMILRYRFLRTIDSIIWMFLMRITKRYLEITLAQMKAIRS